MLAVEAVRPRTGADPAPEPPLPLPLAPSLERRRLRVYLSLLLADGAAVILGFIAASLLYYGVWNAPSALNQAYLVLPFFWTVAIANGAYSAGAALEARSGVMLVGLAVAAAAAIAIFLAYFLEASGDYSRAIWLLGTAFAALFLAILRDRAALPIRRWLGPTGLNLLLIDDGGRTLDLADCHRIDARLHGIVPAPNDPHALHRLAMVLENMDRVLVSCPRERRAAWALVLKGVNIQAEIVDDEIAELGAVGARRTPDYGALVIAVGPLGLRNRILKRGLDLALAGTALVALLPLMVLTAAAILIEDGGPVLFRQRRLGRGNRFFEILKFRSMQADRQDRAGDRSATRGDDRVTRIGRLIRATSIDELPQLFNVLRGDMSLVGPRPHALGSQAGDKLFWEIDARYWQRHSLKPGMTGLAQVRGLRGATDHETDLVERLQADLEYLDGWTLGRDLGIILGTLRVIVHRRAY